MGAKRRFNGMLKKYRQTFKEVIHKVDSVIDKCDKKSVVSAFRYMYPNLWEQLEKKEEYYKSKNADLYMNFDRKCSDIYNPANFIYEYYCMCIHNRKRCKFSEEKKNEADIIIEKVRKESLLKYQTSKNKIDKKMEYIQEVKPKYYAEFKRIYYECNKDEDLHKKLEIMRELSNYKCRDIIEFFRKINKHERNASLKWEAISYLQMIGEHVVLERKKEGKKTSIDNEIVKNEENPDVLAKRLYVEDLENLKQYDAFISHSVLDMDLVKQIKKEMNAKGEVLYIDWLNDKTNLKREYCNASTAEVIKRRIEQSEKIILLVTNNIFSSQWVPWELGYAMGCGKKIEIINPRNIDFHDYSFYEIREFTEKFRSNK